MATGPTGKLCLHNHLIQVQPPDFPVTGHQYVVVINHDIGFNLFDRRPSTKIVINAVTHMTADNKLSVAVPKREFLRVSFINQISRGNTTAGKRLLHPGQHTRREVTRGVVALGVRAVTVMKIHAQFQEWRIRPVHRKPQHHLPNTPAVIADHTQIIAFYLPVIGRFLPAHTAADAPGIDRGTKYTRKIKDEIRRIQMKLARPFAHGEPAA